MPKRKLIPDVVENQSLVCLPPDATVRDAVQRMAEHRIAAVLVTEGTALKGIFTERDLTVRVAAAGKDIATTPLSAVMTADPDTLGPDAPATDALDLMERHRYRHLPVVQDGAVVAIVSIRDLYSEVRNTLQEEIKEREAFIFGSQFSVQS